MAETVDPQKINEIGKGEFVQLIGVLKEREDSKYNVVGWLGTSNELQTQINEGLLCPASSFAVITEGMARYKRTDQQMREDTDSLRDLSNALLRGSEIYSQAVAVDESKIKEQVKIYVESHGGTFDNETNWQDFIKERANKLKARADAIDEINK